MKALRMMCGLFAFIAFAGTALAAEPIKLGVYLPLTGDNAFGGQLELEGVQLAHQQFPEVLGRPVTISVVDNKSDKVEAANAVSRLIENDKVVGIIGTYGSSLAMAGGEVAERAGIPMIGTSCTNPLVTQGKKYSFRACFIDPYQGAGAAAFAFKNRGYRKAALLTDISNDYAVGLSNFFRRSFLNLGGEIVSIMNYQAGDQDYTAQLTEIISKNPDVVFMPAYFAQGSIIMKQARELGGKFVLMGGDAMDNPDTVKIAGKAAEGFLQTTFPYSVNMPKMSPEAKAFTDAWKAAYPQKDPNVNAALGYNSYLMFIDAFKRAGTDDPEAVTSALAATKNLSTPLGVLTLNETHDAEMPVGIIEIRDGKSVYLGEVVLD
ncbi:MAG: ABC transporter substrate-binding protein [Planctomycetota bacterium]|jgi:branched-chain amino acid transport system substrate-binding protein|nr:ABC transporter substrate-binding protein [Planctomycetota bacterium]